MEIAEAAIGHVRSGLVATYDKNDFWSERVDAFENMSAHIAKSLRRMATRTKAIFAAAS